MEHKVNKKVLLRFLLGQSSKEEDKLIFSDKASKNMLAEKWQEADEIAVPDEEKAKIYHRVRKQINRKATLIRLQPLMRVAAVLAVGFLLAGIIFYDKIFTEEEQLMLFAESPAGERTSIELPDGTAVVLNGASRIEYPESFNDEERSVRLSGRAFFDVAHDAAKPFTVSTAGFDLRVLGTRFAVTSYPRGEHASAVLVSGSVLINPKKQARKIKLKPNQQYLLNTDNQSDQVKNVNAKKLTAWVQGKLVFDQQNIYEISRELEYWYGVKITVRNAPEEQHLYTITIDGNSLEEVLMLLSKVSPMQYSINGTNVNITYQ